MAKIAFLGMGAMGSRMALNLIKAGNEVCVWNRNIQKTVPLAEAGATVADTPKQAAIDADFLISMLRDDDASKTTWCDEKHGALSGMKTGAVAIDCSTLTVEWMRELHQRCADKNIAFLDAPVAGSRPQAEAAQLIFFVGGNKNVFDRTSSILQTMGGAAYYAGSAGAGASIKLAVNTLFGVQLATMAELVNLLKTNGLDRKHAIEILTATPVCSPAAKLAASSMLVENFSPMFPISLVEKDFMYAMQNANNNNQKAPMTEAALTLFQLAIEKGFGEDNITGIAQVY